MIDVVVNVECLEPIEAERWSNLLAAALASEGVEGPTSVGLSFVDSATIAELNETHMGQVGPTDVLSFPLDGADPALGAPALVGDVVVCVEVAAQNAPGHAGSLEDELALLIVHSALHLLGHDHAVDVERESMQARERELLKSLYGPLGRDPWNEN